MHFVNPSSKSQDLGGGGKIALPSVSHVMETLQSGARLGFYLSCDFGLTFYILDSVKSLLKNCPSETLEQDRSKIFYSACHDPTITAAPVGISLPTAVLSTRCAGTPPSAH